MSLNDSRKKYIQRHKELGLCIHCPRKALDRSLLCLLHYSKKQEYDKKRYQENKVRLNALKQKLRKKYKENNQCTSCSMPLLDEDIGIYVTCESCRSYRTIPKRPKYKPLVG